MIAAYFICRQEKLRMSHCPANFKAIEMTYYIHNINCEFRRLCSSPHNIVRWIDYRYEEVVRKLRYVLLDYYFYTYSKHENTRKNYTYVVILLFEKMNVNKSIVLPKLFRFDR